MSAIDAADRAAKFLDACRRSQAVTHALRGADEAVELVCERAAEAAAGAGIAAPASDPLMERLGVLDALDRTGLDLVRPDHPAWRDAVAACRVGITGSVAGIVETGTVALACGRGAPRAVSLLPDTHLCVVAASSLHARFEDALPAVTAGGLPPNLVWMTGPSRSADIEKQITLGVHGPRTVEIVLVDI